jgi:hypothetical protein
LLNYLGPSVLVLHQTAQDASVELNKTHSSLEEAVLNLISLVQSLPPQAKTLWNQCDFRRANIGIQAGDEPHEASFTLSSEILSLLASAQFEITFTVYAPSDRQNRRKSKQS